METPASRTIAFRPRPCAYWDRDNNVVRDWSTNQEIPTYEGPCLVYLDVRGPLVLNTFLHNGQRRWEGVD